MAVFISNQVMNRLLYKIVILFTFLQCSILLNAQAREYTFEKLSLEEGLSQSSVYSIFQDSKGFLWVGTANGLNKYDGYEFTVFKHDPEDSGSISSDMIYCITEDKYGHLWIGTENDLNKYDPVKNKFIHCLSITDQHDLPISKTILSVTADKNGIIWMGTQGGGLVSYNPFTGKVKWHKNNPDGEINSGYGFVRTVKIDNAGIIWLATQGGLASYNSATGKFKNYRDLFLKKNSSVKKEVYALFPDKDGCIWYTDDYNLYRFDETKEELKSYPLPGNEMYRTWALTGDSKGNVWLGTTNGLLVFNQKNHSYDIIKSDPSKLHSISDNTIMTMLEDRGGVIWIGTLAGGLNKYTGNKNKFRQFKNIPGDNNSITPGLIYAIHEDRTGNLWVGTTDGLNKIDRSGKVTRYLSIKGNKKKPEL
jgi:ligand-binding sensor domain-containing protein